MIHRPALAIRLAFVDSSAHFALLDRHDQRHSEARAIQEGLIRRRGRLFTISFVVAETHALVLTRLTQPIATAFLREIENSATTVIWVTPTDVEAARAIIYRYDDKRFSLTDATSFAVMDLLGIVHAFTFDHNFAQYGMTILTPDNF